MQMDKNDYMIINDNQNGKVDLTDVITSFIKDCGLPKSKSIYCLNTISAEHLNKHKKFYLRMDADEIPLVMLNKRSILGLFMGLVITNKCIHFCTLKNSIFTSVCPWLFKGPKGKAFINQLDLLEIAELDTCLGYTYMGHQLKINNEVIGLIRIGMGVLPDEKALEFLNGLFDYLADNEIVTNNVREYAWQ